MATQEGTTLKATVARVVDGDTLVVDIDGREEKLRLAALDTEESNRGSDKPVTPWGKKAKEEATAFFPAGTTVTLEFAGSEPPEEAIELYRDNFGRLLVWAYRDDEDFQEHMIGLGFSPYFTKYGFADFAGHHARYLAAQRRAQTADIGVWNQVAVNGSEMRNYALLGVWWDLRGQLIEDYRRHKAERPELLNSRRDYAKIVELAEAGAEAVIFTELRTVSRVGQNNAIVEIGSKSQPFKLFLPDVEGAEGQAILALLDNAYVDGDDSHPRRSYAYVQGPLKLFREEPELVVTSALQITDSPPE
jgi:micrococcal nuclease